MCVCMRVCMFECALAFSLDLRYRISRSRVCRQPTSMTMPASGTVLAGGRDSAINLCVYTEKYIQMHIYVYVA